MENLISVIVPVYNVESYVSPCLESIINQTYRNLQIILIDDGSTDDSGKICDEYGRNDSRITVIHQENKGASAARNAGLTVARGEFISFIDSDDIIDPSMYEQMFRVIKDFDVIECGFQRFKEEAEITRISGNKLLTAEMTRYDALKNLVFHPGMTASFCNKLFRRSLFADLRFEEGIICEDEHLIFRVLDNIEKYGYLDGEFYCYRTRENSVMTTKLSMKQLDAIYVWDDRCKYCKEHFYTDFMLKTQSMLYYECINLFKKKYFRNDEKANRYITSKIKEYKREFFKNPYIKLYHRVLLRFGQLYKLIFALKGD